MNERLEKKKIKQLQERVNQINNELDILMNQYICSDGIYGDIELFSKINKLELEKKSMIKLIKESKTHESKATTKTHISIDSILFKLDDTSFQIIYRKNGKRQCKKIPICKNDMSRKSVVSKEIITKYGEKSLDETDINLYSALTKFDKEMGTSYARDLVLHKIEIPVQYQFNKFYHAHSSLSFLDKLKIKINAKKNNTNSIFSSNNSKVRYLASAAVISLVVFAGAMSLKNHSDQLNTVQHTMIEQDLDNDSLSLDDFKEDLEKSKDISETQVIQTKEKKIDNSADDTVNTKKKSFKMNSNYYLDSVDLSCSSTEAEPSVNTDDLDCDYYRPALISIRNDDGIKKSTEVKEIKNKKLSNVVNHYIKKYGKGIKFSVNFDGYDKKKGKVSKNIGWVDLVDLYVDNDKTSQEKVDDLKKIRNVLKNNDNKGEKTSHKVYKKI